MDLQQQDYCVMECGEEELGESQGNFYSSKQKDWDELMQSVCINQPVSRKDISDTVVAVQPSAPRTSSVLWSPLEKSNANTTSAPSTGTLVVLNPSVLNQLAGSSGYVVSTSSIIGTPSVSTSSVRHSLPAVVPPVSSGVVRSVPGVVTNVRFDSQPRTSQPTTISSEALKLSSLLCESQFNASLNSRPMMNMRHPTPPNPPVHHIPASSSPTAPVPKVRVTAPPNYAPASLGQIRVRPPSSMTAAPPPPRLRTIAPSSINYTRPPHYLGPRVRLPAPSKSIGSSDPSSIENLPPILGEMRASFSDPKNVLPNPSQKCEASTKTVPPCNVPMLPETRPEAASDSRPRARPGPASRTRPVPPANTTLSSDRGQTSNLVDLTEDEPPNSKKAPVREKTFPSLIVVARSSLKIFSAALVNNEKLLMDNQIRKVLQMSPSDFVEYLLQKRLLKAEQFCEVHNKPLKLGIYSDPNRFPVSGGYVWIAECCKSGFCSVYSGSIFDKTLQPPPNILKLMYHWACNTPVHNVLNWVKVDSYIVKTYNTFFRAVCTTMIHQNFALLGGLSKNIQVGVISIGTYVDGETKEVKVDIIGVMDPDTVQIRLKVLENLLSDSRKVYESKFRKILDVLKEWVHPKSRIIMDFAVDTHLFHEFGFSDLVVSGGKQSPYNNNAVMDYMRAKIPTMFQNTLGLLSHTIIQQFLDELVWRETWGPFSSRAYETLLKNISELTKLPGPDLVTKLKRIASDPSQNWKFSVWDGDGEPDTESVGTPNPTEAQIPKLAVPKGASEEATKETEHPKANVNNESLTVRPESSISPSVQVQKAPGSRTTDSDRKIFLEPFYYGVIEGNPVLQKPTGAFLAECSLCKRDFLSASSFTKHLIHHALNDSTVMSKTYQPQILTLCPLCCVVVQDLESHKKSHPPPLGFMCKICRLDLKTEEKLIKHMVIIHQELDMPYKCDICNFQTSIYDSAVHHFKELHDKDAYLRCPYCMKCIRFLSKSGVEISRNQYYFIQHVQKHGITKLNRKCEKCFLSFNNMATLKQHQEKVHLRSGRLLKNVHRIKGDPAKMIMMPIPMQAPLPPVTLNENCFHTLKGKALSSSVKVPEYYAVCSCLECDGPMTQNHFSVKMTCTTCATRMKCSFQSCCPNAIREHSARFHQLHNDSLLTKRQRKQMLGGSAALDKALYCSYCTYSSTNGNKMAAHLVNCGDGGAVATAEKRKLSAFTSPLKVKHEIY